MLCLRLSHSSHPRRLLTYLPSTSHLEILSSRRHNSQLLSQTPRPDRPFNILFFGRDEFSCLVFEQLHGAKDVWESLDIVTQPDMKTGRRGSVLSVSPLKLLGQGLNVPVHTIPPDRPSFRHWQAPPPFSSLPSPSPSHLLVTASFGRILPTQLLRHFVHGRKLNVHPSLLPIYRGAAPIQHALIDGQKETGVCVIEMTEFKKGIDSGEIWAKERHAIPEGIEFPELRDKLAVHGGQLLVSVLRDMLEGKAQSTAQVWDSSCQRAPMIKGEDALVDFVKLTAEDVVRRHRGIAHQKPIFTNLRTGKTLQLHSPTVFLGPLDPVLSFLPAEGTATFHPPTKSLVIRCASGTVLSVPKVRQQDRSLITAKEWWNGVRPEMRLVEGDEGPVQFVS